MSVFQFKQFKVHQKYSAMKVGTDSVLLGCLANAQNPKRILDIGTGSGLLALMMAQRFEGALIDTVEINEAAAKEARLNFSESKWHKRLMAHSISLQEFTPNYSFDFIVSNPPFFEAGNNTLIPELQRATARQTQSLSFHDLLLNVNRLLTPDGICWLVLPSKESAILKILAIQYELYCVEEINIIPKENKPANRLVFALCKSNKQIESRALVIYDSNGKYTEEYYALTLPFLLWLKR